MPPPPTLPAPATPSPLPVHPLTPSAFAPFGVAIQNPGSSSSNASTANQGTASKHPQISPVQSFYPSTSPAASTNLNLFSCAPRKLSPGGIFACRVLERHPYTTQTFIPLALARDDPDTSYVVIVAPTGEDGMPVLEKLRAFRARGDQAVTYAAGTWHAPMVVVGGERNVDFCVLVAENGTAEDCEEIFIGGGGVPVKVLEQGNWGLWEKRKARL